MAGSEVRLGKLMIKRLGLCRQRPKFVIAICVVLAGCANTQSGTITLGAGGNYYRQCAYESFQAKDDYGIFKVAGSKDANLVPFSGMPSEGATISGDLSGFGVRVIHDDSTNTSLTVDITYHAVSYEATLTRMQQLGCFG